MRLQLIALFTTAFCLNHCLGDGSASRRKRSCGGDVFTLESFISLVVKIENAQPSKGADDIANQVRRLGYGGIKFNYFLSDYFGELPDGILTDGEKIHLKSMMGHDGTSSSQEKGVLRTDSGDTIAIGHVITGICAGLARDRNVYMAKILGGSSFDLDNLFVVTISGDIGQTALLQKSNVTKALYGPDGTWDDPSCPKVYTLDSSKGKSEATDAEILGDLDGFLIGYAVENMSNIKVSSLIQQYYSSGLHARLDFVHSNRVLKFKELVVEKDLEAQAIAFAQVYERLGSGDSITVERSQIPSVVSAAVKEFYRYSIMKVCSFNLYGDVMKLNPTGAKAATAKSDGLRVAGVPASQKMVDTDYPELDSLRKCFEDVGKRRCIHPAVVAAIASRESRGGKVLRRDPEGWGDPDTTCKPHGYCGFGIMQCDIRAWTYQGCTQKEGEPIAWNSCDHIDMAVAKILVPKIKEVEKKHKDKSNWPQEKLLQGGIAAYNFGAKNVWNPDERLDIGTSHDDYSNDVVARAQRLIRHFQWGVRDKTSSGGTSGGGTPAPGPRRCNLRSMAESGDCEFYQCVEEVVKCGDRGYPLGYGYRYCNMFGKYYADFQEKGKKWVSSVRKCLMKKLIGHVANRRMTCESLKEIAFDSHPSCYLDSPPGFCVIILDPGNRDAFFKVIQINDFLGPDRNHAIAQVIETAVSCAEQHYRNFKDAVTDKINKVKEKIDSAINKFKSLFSEGPVAASAAVEPTCINFAHTGDCRFYECLNQRFPCGGATGESHLLHFEMVSCRRLKLKAPLGDRQGIRFADDYHVCLMKKLLVHYESPQATCSALMLTAHEARRECLHQAGICSLDKAQKADLVFDRTNDLEGYPVHNPSLMERARLSDRLFPVSTVYFRNVRIFQTQIAGAMCKCRAQPDGGCEPLYQLTLNDEVKGQHYVANRQRTTGYNDSKCSSLQGTCLMTSKTCGGTFTPNLCGGPNNRQCCLPNDGETECTDLNGECRDPEEPCVGSPSDGICAGNRKCCLQGKGDSECTQVTGTCLYRTKHCCPQGEFSTGKCTGPAERQCCIPGPPVAPQTSPINGSFTGGQQSCYSKVQGGQTGYCVQASCCQNDNTEDGLCPGYPSNVKCCFSDNTCNAECGTCADATAKEYACKILALYEEKKIWLKPHHDNPKGNNPYDGASALSNIRDTCYGLQAKRSSYCCKTGESGCRKLQTKGGCVCLKANMLKNMYDYAVDFHNKTQNRIEVNSIAGSAHSGTSNHYKGDTFDISSVRPTGTDIDLQDELVKFCTDRGAYQKCYKGSSCGGHETWVHCSFS